VNGLKSYFSFETDASTPILSHYPPHFRHTVWRMADDGFILMEISLATPEKI